MSEAERAQGQEAVASPVAVPEAPDVAPAIALPGGVRTPERPGGMRSVLEQASPVERRRLVLGMQRSVGNAAVTRYLSGIPRPAPAAPAPVMRASGAGVMRAPPAGATSTPAVPAVDLDEFDDDLTSHDPGQSLPGEPLSSAGTPAPPPPSGGAPPAPPDSGDANQSVDPDAGGPNQSVDPDAPNQSVDPDAGGPNQSVDPAAPNQSVDPDAGGQSVEPNQSVDTGGGGPPAPPAGGGPPDAGSGGAPPDGSGAGPGSSTPVTGGQPDAPPGAKQVANAPQADTTFGQGYNRSEYANQLDDKLTELFNQRADPDAKEKLYKLDTAADTARLASLQYAFNPGSLTTQLIMSVLPADAIVEHFRQATFDNAYAGSANLDSWSGAIAGVQTGIEFGRGVLHILGDVVGAAGTALGVFAVISGGLALIPPLTGVMGPLAVASAAAGEILTLVKAAADIIDTELSIVQVLLNVIRARLSDDPHERARIAQQMKKEANDISGNLIGVGVQAATIGMGKALGKMIPSKAVGETAAALERVTVKEFMKQFSAEGRRLMAAEYKALLKVAANDAKVLGLSRAQLAFEARLRNPASIIEGLRHAGAYGSRGWTTASVVSGRIMANWAGGAAIGTGMGFVGTGGKMANSMSGPQGAGQNNAVPKEVAKPVTTQTVSYWPEVLDKFNGTRGWVQNASERMLDQYNLAREDAGDKQKAVNAVYGGVSRFDGGRIMSAGSKQKAKAESGQSTSEQAADKAKAAKAEGDKAAKKGGEAQSKAGDAKAKTDEAADMAKGKEGDVRKEASLWDKAKQWLYEKTLAKVFGALGTAQKWLNDQILALALDWAGLNGGDLDLAGIERSALGDKAKDEAAKKDAADTAAKGPEVDAAWAKMTEGATDQEKNAMQGMVDTMSWIGELDNWDQALAAEQETGAAYIQRTAPLLAHETETQEEGDVIDSAYAAPFLDGALQVETQAAESPETLERVCNAALQDRMSALEAAFAPAFAGFDATPGHTSGKTMLAQLMGQATPELEHYGQEAQRIGTAGAALVGTTDYAAFASLSSELDGVSKGLQNVQSGVVRAFDAALQAILDAYMSTAEGLAVPAPGAAPPAGGATSSGSAPAPAPPSEPPPGPVQAPVSAGG